MRIDKIAILTKIASLEFDKIANRILSEYDLTASQYRILKFLYSQETKSSRVVDIEKECAITHPTALGLLDNLEKKGFILKIVNPKDARSKLLSLTEKAQNMNDELEAAGNKIEDLMTENLSDEERTQLAQLLQKLLKIEGEGDKNE